MSSIEKEIEKVEEEIKNTPYNKSTEQHIGRLKSKLAKLKEEKLEKEKKQVGGEGYAIEKTGDATAILVGFPSVGKSTLLNSLTGASSEVAGYDFTTLEVIPGTLKYKGANVQVLDISGIISGASEGKGRGREVISVLRTADLLVLMVDPFELEQYEEIKREIRENGVRLEKEPPKVKIDRKGEGGLRISSTVDLDLSEEEIKSILKEQGIVNADVLIGENLGQDRLIDAVMNNRGYVPGFVLVNKVDLLDESRLEEVQEYVEEEIEEEVLYISAKFGNLDELKDKIFEKLNFIRVYLKPRGEEADKEKPMILKEGADVEELCESIHRDLVKKFRYAKVWGESAKHPSQRVGKNHKLADGDIVTIIS